MAVSLDGCMFGGLCGTEKRTTEDDPMRGIADTIWSAIIEF
jgi:hypothetical protein